MNSKPPGEIFSKGHHYNVLVATIQLSAARSYTFVAEAEGFVQSYGILTGRRADG
jgi:hypothetical protein